MKNVYDNEEDAKKDMGDIAQKIATLMNATLLSPAPTLESAKPEEVVGDAKGSLVAAPLPTIASTQESSVPASVEETLGLEHALAALQREGAVEGLEQATDDLTKSMLGGSNYMLLKRAYVELKNRSKFL